jgi:hypothetical protein
MDKILAEKVKRQRLYNFSPNFYCFSFYNQIHTKDQS